jgi:hypothetical protein
MGLGGIIMGALGGVGEQAASMGATLMKSELDKEKLGYESDLVLNRTKALEDYKNNLTVNTANQQRDAQVARIGAAQAQITPGIVAGNANTFYGDGSTLTPDDLSDEEKASFVPNSSQAANSRIQAAVQTGDYKLAADLTKMQDAGKVTAGYGATVIDQNDIDPTTGKPRVLIDNTSGRAGISQQIADARTTSAGASATRADAAARNADTKAAQFQAVLGSGAKGPDKELNFIVQQGRQLTSQLGIAQKAYETSTKDQRDSALGHIKDIEQAIDANRIKGEARIEKINASPVPGIVSGPTSANTTGSSSGTDYSSLWK